MVNPSATIMTTDFDDAHDRHWRDAERLRGDNRLANADHLYGISAECGLKALMQSFGMSVRNGEPDNRNDRKHIDQLVGRYDAYRSSSVYPNAVNYTLIDTSAFDDWRASQRYAVESAFTVTRVNAHAIAARDVRTLVSTAKLEGLL
jgi:hypothetical protein